jgi:hypothetical protein
MVLGILMILNAAESLNPDSRHKRANLSRLRALRQLPTQLYSATQRIGEAYLPMRKIKLYTVSSETMVVVGLLTISLRTIKKSQGRWTDLNNKL